MKVEVNNVSKEMKKSIKTRVITAIILVLVAVPALFFGSWPFVALILLLGIGATFEFIKAPGKSFPFPIYVITLVALLSFVFWVFTKENLTTIDFSSFINNFQMIDLYASTLAMVTVIALYFMMVISSEKVAVTDAFYLFLMTMFISLGLQSALFLRFCPTALYNEVISPGSTFEYGFFLQEALLIVYVIGSALLNDIFAYFVGILFGKHKMNPRISPKKTWEGFFGGVILSVIFGLGFCFICDLLGAPVLKGLLDLEHWYFCLLVSIVIAVVSVLGDLMFSAIKRHFAIKDFGTIFPGHGGILDRFDSVLMTVFVVSTVIVFLAHDPFGILGM